MKNTRLQNIIQGAGALLVLISLAFVLSQTNSVKAQTSGSAPSGTYVCLSNSNMSGYVASKTNDTSTAGINQLFTLVFDASTPNQVTMVGLVANKVSHYEQLNVSTISEATRPNVVLTVTANSPSPYIYKLVAPSGGVTDYYIGVTNSANSLFFMSAPSNTSTMNGACQKV